VRASRRAAPRRAARRRSESGESGAAPKGLPLCLLPGQQTNAPKVNALSRQSAVAAAAAAAAAPTAGRTRAPELRSSRSPRNAVLELEILEFRR